MKSSRKSPPRKAGGKTARTSPPRVALLVGAWNEYGRGIIEGVWQYAQQHGPWFLEMQPSEPDESTDVPRGWSGDGVIASIHTRRLAAKLRGFEVPVVNVSGSRREGIDFPRVTSDAQAVVRMAVKHLRDKGLKHLAFCGEPHRPFIDFWTDAYRKVMRDAGTEAVVYKPSARVGPRAGLEKRQNDRRRSIESLPKPVGVVGWYITGNYHRNRRHQTEIDGVTGLRIEILRTNGLPRAQLYGVRAFERRP